MGPDNHRVIPRLGRILPAIAILASLSVVAACGPSSASTNAAPSDQANTQAAGDAGAGSETSIAYTDTTHHYRISGPGRMTANPDGTASFIGPGSPAVDLSGASWIWYPEGDPAAGVPPSTRYFRRTVSIGSVPAQAQLVVTGDDTADVWVNGQQVSSSPRVTDAWKQGAVVDVASRLVAGNNTIAVAAENT